MMNYWFQKIVVLVLCLFLGMMIVVTCIAFSRKSGTTGMDMGKVQQMRYESDHQ